MTPRPMRFSITNQNARNHDSFLLKKCVKGDAFSVVIKARPVDGPMRMTGIGL